MTPAAIAFERLINILNELREKCPWDKRQTMESLRQLSIEELYELSQAVLDHDAGEIKKELGDLMLHLLFYSKIAHEKGWFSIEDVLNGICEKLIFRHPHIYGDVIVKDVEDVKRNWENLKLKEGNRSVLEGVPLSLPALVKAFRIQEKAAGVGFDWTSSYQVWEKVQEELKEFAHEVDLTENTDSAIDPLSQERLEGEFGDVLFSLINYGRFLGINAEDALEKTNRKFISRFRYIEKQAGAAGIPLDKEHLDQMEAFWNEAKKIS